MIWTIVITVVLTILVVVLAMNFATPEKKLERTILHRYGVSDPQFRREMGVLLGPAILAGNSVVDLENGDEIFPAMLSGIRSAKKTVTFETYIFWSGDVAKQFADAFIERARAGVHVDVTIDWAGSASMDASLLKQMEQAGVKVQRYRPLHWYTLSRLNNRTHRKLLVIDGRIGFTGGVGIGDPWQGHAQDPDHWRDIHFRIEGPVVAQIQSAFNDNWIKTSGELLNGADYFPQLEPVGTMDAHMFISSPDVPDGDRGGRALDRPVGCLLHTGRPDLRCDRRRAPSRCRGPRPDAWRKHRFGRCANGIEGQLGPSSVGGREDVRVHADDVPQQGADR